MSYNRILFWKWDDSDFVDGEYLRKIDDIARRSVFDTLLVAQTWCRPSLHEPAGKAAIAAACERAHSHGIRMLFDIDVRPARAEFLRRFPGRGLGIVGEIEVALNAHGQAAGETQTRESGDHYGNYYPIEARLLRAYAYSANHGGYEPGSLADVTARCRIVPGAPGTARVEFECGDEYAGRRAMAFVVFQYDYPDIFSPELLDYHRELMEMYSDVPLDGATIDEWGAFPHPGFDFSGAWRRPWYSDAFSRSYKRRTGRGLALDFLNTRVPPSGDPAAQIRAINDYYAALRERNVEIEQVFYNCVKQIWGAEAFVGVHPTWFAIEETANTPEIWKNGVDWWDVRRDFGQTDEIMIYPVRTALAHKWGGAVFYNMWYGMGSDERTFWAEAWENLRFGGRTHTLSYECKAETPGVVELAKRGLLESVSEIEDLIGLANLFQKTAVSSNVAVVMGYPAAVNWTVNVEDGVHWRMDRGAFCDAFRVAQELFRAGFVCDLIASYEIDDGDLSFEGGKLAYGTQNYDALVYVRPEFSTGAALKLMREAVEGGFPTAILGKCGEDSGGADVSAVFGEIASRARMYSESVDSAMVIEALKAWGIEVNDVENGSRLQDGSVIVCTRGQVRRGQRLAVESVMVKGHRVDAVCEDAFGIALSDDGNIERVFGGKLAEVRVDGEVVLKPDCARDIYVERTSDGCRAAETDGRRVRWYEVDALTRFRI